MGMGLAAVVVMASSAVSAGEELRVAACRCEYKVDPIGIDASRPRMSWRIESPRRAVLQSAYQIRAAGSLNDVVAAKSLLWDSGKVPSDRSTHVPYAGPDLSSR